MDSSDPSANTNKSSYKWAEILGTFIAVLTLTLPVVAIARFSSSNVELLPATTYTLTNKQE